MMANTHKQESVVRTFVWIGVMLGVILFKGFFSFFVVSDMGQPAWDYRTVKDIPAQSAYANYVLLPNQQHVRGNKGE